MHRVADAEPHDHLRAAFSGGRFHDFWKPPLPPQRAGPRFDRARATRRGHAERVAADVEELPDTCRVHRGAYHRGMGIPAIDTGSLTPAELVRLRLIDNLWDSVTSTPEAIPLTPLQRDELDRRLGELDRGDVALVPWDEVKRQLRARGDQSLVPAGGHGTSTGCRSLA